MFRLEFGPGASDSSVSKRAKYGRFQLCRYVDFIPTTTYSIIYKCYNSEFFRTLSDLKYRKKTQKHRWSVYSPETPVHQAMDLMSQRFFWITVQYNIIMPVSFNSCKQRVYDDSLEHD